MPFRRDRAAEADRVTGAVFRSMRTRRRRLGGRRWLWGVAALVVVAAGLGGYLAWLYYHTQGQIQDPVPGIDPVGTTDAPFVVLLVGSDSRAGLTPRQQHEFGADPVEGQRADTLILAQVDPRSQRIVMVQFPRDLYVQIAGGEKAKINSALEKDMGTLVATVKDLTGLDINHYVQVNIAGFKQLVDAIGGVEVCIPEPIPFDPQTGIEVTEEEVGMVHFDGERALRFVRSRAFPNGDLDRIQNQQRFLVAALDKVLSVGNLLRLDRVQRVAHVAGRNLTVDEGTDLRELLDIGRRFRAFDPDDYEAYVAPNRGPGFAGELSIVEADPAAMEVMFEAMARNRSPAEFDGVPSIDPHTVRVGVYNGTFKEGLAATAATKLRAATDTGTGGVMISEIANARRFGHDGITIRHTPETRAMANLVAAALPEAALEEVDRTRPDIDVEVIVGRGRLATQPIVQFLPIPIPRPSALPPECR